MAETAARPLSILPLTGMPEVVAGDDLAELLCAALDRAGLAIEPGDILVVAQKIVSKAEARAVDVATVEPSVEARAMAVETRKDPALVQCVLDESQSVLRARPDVLIVRHRLGMVMANAGIDRSNVPDGEAGERLLLLPVDPDGSAAAIRAGLSARTGVAPGVIISDSFGRAWRKGVVNVAIGVVGTAALVDRRGAPDRAGRALMVTEIGQADAVAAAAGIVMGEGAEGCPAVLVRGAPQLGPDGDAAQLIRPIAQDLFQ